jgi:hypothetical protein
VAIILLSAGLAFGQQPKADCKASAPDRVEGQVVRVDPGTDKATIRDKSGPTHEFHARSAELNGGERRGPALGRVRAVRQPAAPAIVPRLGSGDCESAAMHVPAAFRLRRLREASPAGPFSTREWYFCR